VWDGFVWGFVSVFWVFGGVLSLSWGVGGWEFVGEVCFSVGGGGSFD